MLVGLFLCFFGLLLAPQQGVQEVLFSFLARFGTFPLPVSLATCSLRSKYHAWAHNL